MLWKAWTYIYLIIGGIYLGVICNLTICATTVERESSYYTKSEFIVRPDKTGSLLVYTGYTICSI